MAQAPKKKKAKLSNKKHRGNKNTRPSFYFDQYEDVKPPVPIPYSATRETIWQFLAVLNICMGTFYIYWRWTSSLNMEALWMSVPLALAETASVIGLYLYTYNLWSVNDEPEQSPPRQFFETQNPDQTVIDIDDIKAQSRSIIVDIFFTTYQEDPELVRLSIQDAKKLEYPHDIDIRLYVLDDGNRSSVKKLAKSEGVGYIARDDNRGFKAGNLCNASLQTGGDFMVICDADTRLFPTFLQNTMGYFKDPKVAWVQTPQWFYDIPQGRRLHEVLATKIGIVGSGVGKFVERIFGKITIGNDPYNNEPTMFYDILMRRRNRANASFCCGAGSIHRRDAVMQIALQGYVSDIEKTQKKKIKDLKKTLCSVTYLDPNIEKHIQDISFQDTEMMPFKHHISEDIYTSILTHSLNGVSEADPDETYCWRSVLHPYIESKMLSPQDYLTWVKQRYRYAAGTLDIAINDNPLWKKGLSLSQKVCYGATFWSYFGALWTLVFLVCPIIFLITGISPVKAYSVDFFFYFIPFILLNELAFMTGQWGTDMIKHKRFYLGFFPYTLKALWGVIRGKKLSFEVTRKTAFKKDNFLPLVWPQILFIGITIGALLYAWLTLYTEDNYKFTYLGVITNSFWSIFNIYCLSSLVMAALYKPFDEAPESAVGNTT